MNRTGRPFGPHDRRRALFRVLLLLTPASTKQLPFLLEDRRP